LHLSNLYYSIPYLPKMNKPITIETFKFGRKYRSREAMLTQIEPSKSQQELGFYVESALPQLIFIQQGKIKVDNQPYDDSVFCTQETLIVPPKQKIEFSFLPQDGQRRLLALELPIERINHILYDFKDYCPFTVRQGSQWLFGKSHIHICASEDIEASMLRVEQTFVSGDFAPDAFIDLAIRELFLKILHADVRDFIALRKEAESSMEAMENVLQYIRENINEPITIEQLAEIACMSQAAFFRAFKEYSNMSPIDYINRERINSAKQQLINFSKSVTDICYELGYNHMTYFIRVFKKYEGITPKQFQKQFQKNDKSATDEK
jgi:AraC-like DNA-binding protein